MVSKVAVGQYFIGLRNPDGTVLPITPDRFFLNIKRAELYRKEIIDKSPTNSKSNLERHLSVYKITKIAAEEVE